MRTYSTDHGPDQIPEIARRHGLKVMQGLWLSSLPDLTRKQIETGIASARYPDVIQAVIIGNEVLLRGEMSATALSRAIREVKAQVSMPVTYADVWEFWLRHRDVAAEVDFITIHVLPYWEDRRRRGMRRRTSTPSAGRSSPPFRAGTSSSASSMAEPLPCAKPPCRLRSPRRVMHEVLATAKRGNYPINLIEAYDHALEAAARRHGRRPLGSLRCLPAAAQVRLGRHRLEPSAVALAGRRGGGVGGAGLAAAIAARRRSAGWPEASYGCASPPSHSCPAA